ARSWCSQRRTTGNRVRTRETGPGGQSRSPRATGVARAPRQPLTLHRWATQCIGTRAIEAGDCARSTGSGSGSCGGESSHPDPHTRSGLPTKPMAFGIERHFRLPEAVRHMRFSAREVPYIAQLDALECGAACLAMVLGFHGHHAALPDVRAACAVSRDGVNALAMIEAAQKYG